MVAIDTVVVVIVVVVVVMVAIDTTATTTIVVALTVTTTIAGTIAIAGGRAFIHLLLHPHQRHTNQPIQISICRSE